jgi:hypothetical protein
MAYFTKINENNIVINIVAVNNKVITDANGQEQEQLGIDFCKSTLGDGNYKQTSYNGTFRKNYAGLGYTYDETRDAFIAPKPYNSWILNENTCKWEPPIPRPEGTLPYIWDEAQQNWVLLNN